LGIIGVLAGVAVVSEVNICLAELIVFGYMVSDEILRERCPMGLAVVTLKIRRPIGAHEDWKLVVKDAPSLLRRVARREPFVSGWVEMECGEMDDSYLSRGFVEQRNVTWCKKRRDVCPRVELARALLRQRDYLPSDKDLDVVFGEPLKLTGKRKKGSSEKSRKDSG